MIDRANFFDQPVKINLISYDNNRKIAAGQGDHYTAGCLLDYNLFNNYHKIIATDLSKQQALDPEPKKNIANYFTANLDWNADTTIMFIFEEPKETDLNFSKGTVKVLWMCSTILFF